MKRFSVVFTICTGALLVSTPAFAFAPVQVPEPGTLSLVGGIAVALIIAHRIRRNK